MKKRLKPSRPPPALRVDPLKEIAGSTAKALGILEAIAEHRQPISITEVSALLGLSKPTGHRVATALEEMGFLQRDPASRRLIEGNRLVRLAFAVLVAAATRGSRHGILEKLAEATGETCNLGVVIDNQVAYIDRVEAHWPLGLRFESGSRVPMHCTAIGKMFLSRMTEREQETFLSTNPLVRYTENTVTDAESLRQELARIRKENTSTDNQEFMSGVVCIAVPVMRPGGRMCAAIALSAPQARLTLEKVRQLAPMLREAAEKMSLTFFENET